MGTGSTDFNLDRLVDVLAEKLACRLKEQPYRLDPRLLTLEQAAIYLGRSREALQHMVSSAKIPTVRADRRIFVDIRDLDHWIEENKIAGV